MRLYDLTAQRERDKIRPMEETPKKQKYDSYAEMKADQQKIEREFALELFRLYGAGMSLRKIAGMKQMNHETVRKMIKEAAQARI